MRPWCGNERHPTGHLQDRTLAYFRDRSATAKPFKWSFRGFHPPRDALTQ